MVNIITGEGATITPGFMLKMGERDITSNIHQRLISLTMTDEKEFQADTLVIELDDTDGLLELPERGVVVSLYLGWQGSAWLGKGTFIVDQVSHQGAPDRVTITARSADFRQKFSIAYEESWHDTTLGAIVNTIAARNNLEASVAESLAGIAVSHIDQSKESDAAFLTRLASLNGGIVSVKNGRLLVLKAGSATNASGQTLPERTILRRSGDSHRFSISDRTSYTGVIAHWLDTKNPKQNAQINVERKAKSQSAPVVQHPNAASAQASPQSQKGQDTPYAEYMAGAPANPFTLKTVFSSQAQAKQAAEARWRQLQRRVVEFSITLAVGDESFCPEMSVRVSGFKKVIDEQRWIVSKVTHKLDQNGFVTTVALEVNNADIEYVIEETNAK
ncbi:contractile injection system protein, VgrG/Pvc8 family [Pseudocitrobacter cyperus]|uniref:Contractile injection system protein, VgrG/Pvc8 family n=1 Tax=Pseudocitrobacter cyperus TaxID=3112843 RepID=A0ABV0HIS2_9ENTR